VAVIGDLWILLLLVREFRSRNLQGSMEPAGVLLAVPVAYNSIGTLWRYLSERYCAEMTEDTVLTILHDVPA